MQAPRRVDVEVAETHPTRLSERPPSVIASALDGPLPGRAAVRRSPCGWGDGRGAQGVWPGHGRSRISWLVWDLAALDRARWLGLAPGSPEEVAVP